MPRGWICEAATVGSARTTWAPSSLGLIFSEILIDRWGSERIQSMKTRSTRLDLSKVPNWPELAAKVKFQAPHLAKYFNVLSRTLERAFREQMHTTPQKALDKFRQAQAEKLVLDRKRTKEVAYQLEYKRVSHFCRQWKHFHGMSVGEWRNERHGFFGQRDGVQI